jgi:hypothetical protein
MNLNSELENRRNFFNKNFDMIKIGKKRVDIDSYEILKNTCPVCGYLTLNERDSFEICQICFWEDDGIDDYEADVVSGPNHMSLNEARLKFKICKEELLKHKNKNDIKSEIRLKFINLDEMIVNDFVDKGKIIKAQNELINLFISNNINGLEELIKM